MALCELDDINSFLPDNVVEADSLNSPAVLVNVERYIKAYLAKVAVTSGWTTPELTPSTVKLIAAMLSASQIYFAATAATSLDIDDRNFGELLYQRGVELLHGIVEGTVDIDGDNDVITATGQFVLGFWPDNTTEPKFAMDMEFG